MSRKPTLALLLCLLGLSGATHAQSQPTREQQVRQDKQAFAKNDAWIYDDLEAAIQQAERSRRPLMIVFR